MTLNFPGIFPPSKEINLSFSWVDLASATGYVTYDFFSTVDTVGINRLLVETSRSSGLSSVTTYSTSGSIVGHCLTTGGTTSASFAKIIDIDFDASALQLPRILRGTMFVNFWGYIWTSVNTTEFYYVVRLRKWDGSSETEISTAQSPTNVRIGNQDLEYAFSMEVPQTSFKKGEQIRVTIEGWAKNDSGGTAVLGLAGDPKDAVQTDGTHSIAAGKTRIIAAIPFKLDI